MYITDTEAEKCRKLLKTKCEKSLWTELWFMNLNLCCAVHSSRVAKKERTTKPYWVHGVDIVMLGSVPLIMTSLGHDRQRTDKMISCDTATTRIETPRCREEPTPEDLEYHWRTACDVWLKRWGILFPMKLKRGDIIPILSSSSCCIRSLFLFPSLR